MFTLVLNAEFNQSRFPGHLMMQKGELSKKMLYHLCCPIWAKNSQELYQWKCVAKRSNCVLSLSLSRAKKSLGKKVRVTECENIGFQKPNSDLGWYFDGRPTTGCQMVLAWDRILASLSQLQCVRDIRDMSLELHDIRSCPKPCLK